MLFILDFQLVSIGVQQFKPTLYVVQSNSAGYQRFLQLVFFRVLHREQKTPVVPRKFNMNEVASIGMVRDVFECIFDKWNQQQRHNFEALNFTFDIYCNFIIRILS